MKFDSNCPTPSIGSPFWLKSTYTWIKLENWRVSLFFTLEEESLNLSKVGFDSICEILLKKLVSYSTILASHAGKLGDNPTPVFYDLDGNVSTGGLGVICSPHKGLSWPTWCS